MVEKRAGQGAVSRPRQDSIFCSLRFLCVFIINLLHHFPSTCTYSPIYNAALSRVTRSQARHSIASSTYLVPAVDLIFTLKVNLAASSKTLTNMYQTTQHVPDYTACTRLDSMYQTILHVPDYTAYSRLSCMYQTTQHVPDYIACTRLHSIYQTPQHVPD